jgi:indolepyruvate decarboxylase
MAKTTSVAEYIVERLAAEGVRHCFGVAGDYVFPVCDAVDSNALVKWIGCANELNAAYAADGAFIEIIGDRLDMPPVLAFAHGRLSAMYGETP